MEISMQTKMKTSWKVVKNGVNTVVYEIRGNEGQTYAQSQQEAVAHLESLARPYLERLEALRADEFLERGRLPDLQVWENSRLRVAAKTKKRAMELLRCSRDSFDSCYVVLNDGNWWYSFAREERVWARQRDRHGLLTEWHVKVLTEEEVETLLKAAFAPYKRMAFSELERLVDEEVLSQGVTPAGAPYSLRVAIQWYGDECVKVEAEIEDEFVVLWPSRTCILRHRDEEPTAVSAECCQAVVCA
jgi:hypothetical protein